MNQVLTKNKTHWAGAVLLLGAFTVFGVGCGQVQFQQIDAKSAGLENNNGCNESGITQASIVTQSVKNGASSSFIQYEISVKDCNGVARLLTNKPILFDIDAKVDTGVPNSLTYKIVTNQSTVTGNLQIVQGSDLFGNTGSNFFYYKTDQNVLANDTTEFATLYVYLNGQIMFPFGYSGNLHFAPPSFTTSTYVAFGAATPVTAPINFYP